MHENHRANRAQLDIVGIVPTANRARRAIVGNNGVLSPLLGMQQYAKKDRCIVNILRRIYPDFA